MIVGLARVTRVRVFVGGVDSVGGVGLWCKWCWSIKVLRGWRRFTKFWRGSKLKLFTFSSFSLYCKCSLCIFLRFYIHLFLFHVSILPSN